MDINKSVGRNIKDRREAAGLTRGQLAHKCGLTDLDLEGFEEGHTDIRLLDLLAISTALGCSMADLFRGT